jgi:DNA-binding response OmpR family regulator
MAKKVLLIDDEEEMVEMVAVSLLKAGYEVLSAFTSSEGMAKAVSEKPDVILLDVMMPEIDGFEVCNKLKGKEETKNIPVIFFTAMGTPDLEEKCLQAGACSCVVKPFDPEELIEKIKAALK